MTTKVRNIVLGVFALAIVGTMAWWSIQGYRQSAAAPQATPSASQAGQSATWTARPAPSTSTAAPDPSTSPTALPGAPSAEDLASAKKVAAGFMVAINDYGYPDAKMYDFVDRARPYMTSSYQEFWLDISTEDSPSDAKYWAEYTDQKMRHKAEVGDMALKSFDDKSVLLAVVYKSGDVFGDNSLLPQAQAKIAEVQLMKVDGTWLVQDVTMNTKG